MQSIEPNRSNVFYSSRTAQLTVIPYKAEPPTLNSIRHPRLCISSAFGGPSPSGIAVGPNASADRKNPPRVTKGKKLITFFSENP